MSLSARLILFLKCLSCCSDKDVLLGSSQVSSPQHKPHQLELHPGQHSTNGNCLPKTKINALFACDIHSQMRENESHFLYRNLYYVHCCYYMLKHIYME